jgi:hypothetical protein
MQINKKISKKSRHSRSFLSSQQKSKFNAKLTYAFIVISLLLLKMSMGVTVPDLAPKLSDTKASSPQQLQLYFRLSGQGILKGEVSLYH